MVRTQIQLTKEQHESLKELAKDRGCSLAELVREGVDLVLQNRLRPSREEAVKGALSIIGIASDAPDLSERHDDYFAEACGQ